MARENLIISAAFLAGKAVKAIQAAGRNLAERAAQRRAARDGLVEEVKRLYGLSMTPISQEQFDCKLANGRVAARFFLEDERDAVKALVSSANETFRLGWLASVYALDAVMYLHISCIENLHGFSFGDGRVRDRYAEAKAALEMDEAIARCKAETPIIYRHWQTGEEILPSELMARRVDEQAAYVPVYEY